MKLRSVGQLKHVQTVIELIKLLTDSLNKIFYGLGTRLNNEHDTWHDT